MRRRLLHIMILVALTGVTLGETIDRVRFHGNRHFASRDLSGSLALPTESEVGSSALERRLQAMTDSMYAQSFLFARVDSHRIAARGRRTILDVYVSEGPLARVREVRWLGDSLRIPARQRTRLRTAPDAVFRWSTLRSDIEDVLDVFEQTGYPFARVEILDIAPAMDPEPVVNLSLKLLSGPFVRISFVSFQGNQLTRSEFLQRETRLRTGEAFDARNVASARRRLNRLTFTRRVQPGRLLVNQQGETGVEFEIEETRMSRIDAVIGYSPGTDDEDGTVSGLVDLELQNFFGGGRRARVHWERPNEDVQQIDLGYREPWLLDQPLALELTFSQRVEDTLYVTRKIGVELRVYLSPVLSVWGAASAEAVIIDSADARALALAASNTNYLETGFAFDTRDHPLNPRSGVFFSTFAGQGWRKLSDESVGFADRSITQHRGGIDSEAAMEFLPYWIADLSVHARATESDEREILLPDLYRLGGARSLRGYREEQFLGSRIGWASAELRYWLGPASRLFGFVDAGGAFRETIVADRPESITIFKTAAGIGLRMGTALGVWGIDYGVGEGDNLLLGKLHVSLVSSF